MAREAVGQTLQPTALVHKVRLKLTGNGVAKDPKQAVKWFLLGADQGHVISKINFGDCLATDTGTAPD